MTMRICEYCDRPENSQTRTCTIAVVNYADGLLLPPIPYDPTRDLFEKVAAGTMTVSDARVILARRLMDGCAGCGVAPGKTHHPDCRLEHCPRCGEMLMTECECVRDCLDIDEGRY